MEQESSTKRIVAPLDGSEAAEAALPLALELADRFTVPLHLIRVVDAADLPDLWTEAGVEPVARELVAAEQMANEYLACVSRRLREQGHAVTAEIRRGGAVRQLLAAAGPGDLVVIARRGRGGTKAGLGSVISGVVARSPVPIVLTPASASSSGAAIPCGAQASTQ